MAESEFVYVTYIRSTPEKVWQALTERSSRGDSGGHCTGVRLEGGVAVEDDGSRWPLADAAKCWRSIARGGCGELAESPVSRSDGGGFSRMSYDLKRWAAR